MNINKYKGMFRMANLFTIIGMVVVSYVIAKFVVGEVNKDEEMITVRELIKDYEDFKRGA